MSEFWAQFTDVQAGTLTVACPNASEVSGPTFSIDVYDGDDPGDDSLILTADYEPAGSTDVPPIILATSPSGIYTFRVRTDDPSAAEVFALDWTFDASEGTAILSFDRLIKRTPSSARVSGLGFTPGDDIAVEVVGEQVMIPAATAADSTGIFVMNANLPPLTAGTHTFRAEDQHGVWAERTFTVQETPFAPPSGLPADADPLPVEQEGVFRWVLQDPAPGGLDQLIFSRNPEKASSPHVPRNYAVDVTTSPQGQALVWEGGIKAHQWTFSGRLDDIATINGLAGYYRLNRRFWLIDHRQRAWIVTFSNLDLTPIRSLGQPNAHRYEISALIFRGPVDMTDLGGGGGDTGGGGEGGGGDGGGGGDAPVARDDLVYGTYRPDAATTGHIGSLTVHTGDLTTTSNGQLIENLDITGRLILSHDDVEVRNCRIQGGTPVGTSYGSVKAFSARSTAKFYDCTIMTSVVSVYATNGVQGRDFELHRCNIYGTVDGVGAQYGNVGVYGCWIHDLPWYAVDPITPSHTDGTHNDGIQCHGGGGSYIFRGNAIEMGAHTNSAIMAGQETGQVTGLIIDKNWIISTSNCSTGINIAENRHLGAMTSVQITDNRFSDAGTWDSGHPAMAWRQTYDVATISGNVYDSDDSPAAVQRVNLT